MRTTRHLARSLRSLVSYRVHIYARPCIILYLSCENRIKYLFYYAFFKQCADEDTSLWVYRSLKPLHRREAWKLGRHVHNKSCKYVIYHVSFTRYCVLIECYRPIRLFIVILMSNNIYYLLLDRGEPPVCIHVTKRVSIKLSPISWCHKLKTGVLTTNRHVISIIIDMYLLQCFCKVNYKINNNNQHMN